MTSEQRAQETKRRLDAISLHAEALYELMYAGMIIEIKISDSPIIVAGTPAMKTRRLYIMRPASHLTIKVD